MGINNLSQFGHSFQIKSIVALMTKPKFIEQIVDILDEQYYDGDSNKWIIKHCKEYFVKYSKPITLDAFKVTVSEIENDILKTSVIESLKEVYKNFESQDLIGLNFRFEKNIIFK